MVKIIFFGTPDFVDPVRKVLRENFELVKRLEDSDLIVVASYGRILTKDELEIPKYGAINIHPSKLPKYRGSSPIQNQILDRVKESAITFIKMDEEVDHGPIIASLPFEILESDTFESAINKAFKKASGVLPDIINEFVEGKIKPVEQNHSQASYTKHLVKDDGYFDANNPPSSDKLDRMIRAYHPWPGVFTKFRIKNQELRIKLLPNERVQVEGKKPMAYKDFINGYKEGKEFLTKLNLI